MAYDALARERRRCLGVTREGRGCRAWALWDDPRQLCLVHAGRHHRGPMLGHLLGPRPRRPIPPCRCQAYPFPHRPGGGLCQWPRRVTGVLRDAWGRPQVIIVDGRGL